MSLAEYIEDRTEYAASFGVDVQIVNKPFVMVEGFRATGYFDAYRKVLAIANKAPSWENVAVHEFCHLDQWAAKSPKWLAYDKCPHAQRFDNFIEGQTDLPIPSQKKAVMTIRSLELDCEKRAVKQIIKYSLPIDVDQYIQQANAYMYYHAVMAAFRGYHTKFSPARTKAVWETMPTHFLTHKEYDNPPMDFILLCRTHCY